MIHYITKKQLSFVERVNKQDDLFKIFLFVSNSSYVEWGLIRVSNSKLGLGTYHNETVSPLSDIFDKNNVISGVHSHPNIIPTVEDEHDSMYGDRGNTHREIRNNDKGYYKYIYFPNSKRLWNINSNNTQIEFIKLVNHYRELYFGTLNAN